MVGGIGKRHMALGGGRSFFWWYSVCEKRHRDGDQFGGFIQLDRFR